MHCVCDVAFSNPGSILDPILDPPGLPFGSFLALKMVETCLGIRLGPPKSDSRLVLFSAPRVKKRVPNKGPNFDDFEVPKGGGPAAAGWSRWERI